ncbi:MAG: peptidylprolyl isomerase [Phycisphaerae bacterium]
MSRVHASLSCLLPLALMVAACPAAGADGDAIAIVNGSAIERGRLVDALLDAYGVDVLQQLIVLELSKQEAQRRGVRVSPGEIEQEFRDSVDRIAREAGLDPREAKEPQRLQALEALLEQKRISMTEFRISMERNAYLRKLVELDLKVDEATLREEFARTFGERVSIRHIQLPADDAKLINEVVTHLSRDENFADLARQFSQNSESAARGGEMEPFGFDDERIPAALRDAAFSLRPGEISTPIRAGQMVHILKLERRIPPDNARFEDVRADVERGLRERALPKRMSELAAELFRKATVSVLDSRLKPKYEELSRKSRDGS